MDGDWRTNDAAAAAVDVSPAIHRRDPMKKVRNVA
jgi:hypothetical protein